MKTVYRVILKVGYYDTYFDFDCAKGATDFAAMALVHAVGNDRNDDDPKIAISIINVDAEGNEKEEE